jgi:hypothetical protein
MQFVSHFTSCGCYSVLVISVFLYPRYQTLSILITYKRAVLKEFESNKQYINRCGAKQ